VKTEYLQMGGKSMENDLFFGNELLPDLPETLTFLLTSGDERVGKGAEERGPREFMGKVTLDPASARIYALPPSTHETLRIEERAGDLWDFYVVYIPFNLHPAPDGRKYKKVTFSVELDDARITAFDLFPKDITTPVDETRSFTLSPQLKFGEVEASLGQFGRTLHFNMLYPSITAIGEGEHKFYWLYSSDTMQGEVRPGCKHALVVLRLPHGLSTVEGKIRSEVVTARKLGAGWRYVDGKAPSLPVTWKLDTAMPFLSPPAIQPAPAQIVLAAPSQSETHADVCIVGALFEEADAFMEMTQKLCHTQFLPEQSREDKLTYYAATIQNNRGELLRIHVSYPPYNGPDETGLHLKPILQAFQPRLAAMVGICAGDKTRVTLGDLVVAERAFLYDTGKFVAGTDGHSQHLFDARAWSVSPHILHELRTFRSWEEDITSLPHPSSKRQQKDWLLNTLLNPGTPTVDEIPLEELKRFVPDWHEIVFQLQQGAHPLLNKQRKLADPLMIQNLRYTREIFPYRDPARPTCHIAAMASGNAVRSDAPFKDIQMSVRNALAIDMEGATFYRTVAEFPGMSSLLVKGVSDYADAEKDDSFHAYAARASAIYVLGFIKEYVTLERMPRFAKVSV
jgi:nucleoside phosphorylase